MLVTITDANNPSNVFNYEFNRSRSSNGQLSIGVHHSWLSGARCGLSFDSVRIANQSLIPLESHLLGVADMSAGYFGGAVVEGIDTYSVPTGAESCWLANNNLSIYPFSFENGGFVEFMASVPSGETVDVYFRLEFKPYADTEPAYNTERIGISGSNEQLYRVEIPPLAATDV